MKKISILGCGWIGLPLATQLVQQGWTVNGSTTRLEKQAILSENGIIPYLIQADDPIPTTDFFDTPVCLINIPPRSKTRGPAHARQQLDHILAHLTPATWVIFISSTSVYPDTQAEVFEADADTNHPLVLLENQLLAKIPQALILRCGGLMGVDRLPGKYVQGKILDHGGKAPVNYVHQQDVIRAIQTALETKPGVGGIYNIVSPEHPTRREVMEISCRRHQWPMPQFHESAEVEPFKMVSGKAFQEAYHFVYQWPDPKTYV